MSTLNRSIQFQILATNRHQLPQYNPRRLLVSRSDQQKLNLLTDLQHRCFWQLEQFESWKHKFTLQPEPQRARILPQSPIARYLNPDDDRLREGDASKPLAISQQATNALPRFIMIKQLFDKKSNSAQLNQPNKEYG